MTTTASSTASSTNPLTGAASAFTPQQGDLMGRQGTLSEWAGPYVANLLGKTQAIADTPYQVYGGPLTAGASSLQQQLFGGLGSLGFPSQLGKSFTDTGVQQQYMNPYMQQVLQPQMQAMQRQADIQRNMLGAQAAKSGAFGGARAGLMNSQLNADLMRQQQQATGQAYGQAYTQGLGQFNTEQQQAQQLANMIGAAGATQRGIEAEGIKADLDEFSRQRDYPIAMLQLQQSMLQGLPIQSVAAQYQQPSALTNALQGAGGLLDIYNKFFNTTPPK